MKKKLNFTGLLPRIPKRKKNWRKSFVELTAKGKKKSFLDMMTSLDFETFMLDDIFNLNGKRR